MPPAAIWLSISNMPFSLVPWARRAVETGWEYMSDMSVPDQCAAARRARRSKADNNGRHIVGRTPIKGQADQEIGCSLRRIVGRQRRDLAIFDVIGEAVAADHESIAGREGAAG